MSKFKARAHFKPPPGFDRLRDAVYAVGVKVFGPDWRPSDWRLTGGLFNPEIERVIYIIREWCAAGEIAVVYWGFNFDVADLDRKYWCYPDWRHYFLSGKIDLDLPLEDNEVPNKDGYKVRCTREIYLRRPDLDRLVKALPKLRHTATKKVSRANISKFVEDYVQSESHPTETGCREKWAAAGNGTRGRDILDEVYRDLAGKAGISLKRGPRVNSANS